jgi:hypothetical protein
MSSGTSTGTMGANSYADSANGSTNMSSSNSSRPRSPGMARGSSAYVGPYVGYMKFGNFFKVTNDASFTANNRALYGVQAGVSFTPAITLLGNFAYSRTSFAISNYYQTAPAGTSSRDLTLQNVGVWLYDGDVQFRVPIVANLTGSWFAPLGQIGVGAARYTSDSSSIRSAGKNYVAFNYGLGGDFQFLRALGVRVMVKDYVTSFKWDRPSDVTASNISEKNIAHNIAFTAGLNLGF